MKLQYLGHAVFLIEAGEHRIIIDPFIEGNPLCPLHVDELKPDFVLVTHAHWDHWGNTLDLAKKGATVVATLEITNYVQKQGLEAVQMNTGGWANLPFGRVKLTPASHSSSFPDGTYGGQANGFVVEIDGKRLYHAGDTGLFSDMRLIGDLGIDLACLPIGDLLTMGPDDALRTVEFLRPRMVLPMHYDTFFGIQQDPHAFAIRAETLGVRSLVLEPGAWFELKKV